METAPPIIAPAKKRKMIILALALAGFIVLALAVLAFTVTQQKKSVTKVGESAYDNMTFSREAVVEITKTGFVPESLTVTPHTRVKFVNKDSASHIVILNDISQKDATTAAANDPVLPNNIEIAAGSSIAHVFEKHDTYSYHDRTSTTSNVSITVK